MDLEGCRSVLWKVKFGFLLTICLLISGYATWGVLAMRLLGESVKVEVVERSPLGAGGNDRPSYLVKVIVPTKGESPPSSVLFISAEEAESFKIGSRHPARIIRGARPDIALEGREPFWLVGVFLIALAGTVVLLWKTFQGRPAEEEDRYDDFESES